jgi:hypothetical protein
VADDQCSLLWYFSEENPSYVQLKFNIKSNIHKIITTCSTYALDNRLKVTFAFSSVYVFVTNYTNDVNICILINNNDSKIEYQSN